MINIRIKKNTHWFCPFLENSFRQRNILKIGGKRSVVVGEIPFPRWNTLQKMKEVPTG
jgi:hypothetical protein